MLNDSINKGKETLKCFRVLIKERLSSKGVSKDVCRKRFFGVSGTWNLSDFKVRR